jgi:hypothetical protein
MKFTKKGLIKLLQENGITTTTKSIIELMLLALDNEILKREDVVPADVDKRPRGRPRQYPQKEFDSNKVVDPKYYRLRTIRTNPVSVKLTNVDTGEVTSYGSLYKATTTTHHGSKFLIRNNGKVVDGMLIEVTR